MVRFLLTFWERRDTPRQQGRGLPPSPLHAQRSEDPAPGVSRGMAKEAKGDGEGQPRPLLQGPWERARGAKAGSRGEVAKSEVRAPLCSQHPAGVLGLGT